MSHLWYGLKVITYSDQNYSDIENLLYFISGGETISKDAKLYLNVKVLSENEIYKAQSPL